VGVGRMALNEYSILLAAEYSFKGPVTSLCQYQQRYLLVGAGPQGVHILNLDGTRLVSIAHTSTRHFVSTLSASASHIAVGDVRDSVILYTYREGRNSLDLLHSDVVSRVAQDVVMVDDETTAGITLDGTFFLFKDTQDIEDQIGIGWNLSADCEISLGEIPLRIRQGMLAYRPNIEPQSTPSEGRRMKERSVQNALVLTTLVGSIIVLAWMDQAEFEVLDHLQYIMAMHSETRPILGDSWKTFRSEGKEASRFRHVVDGDLLSQFLTLSEELQRELLAGIPGATVQSITAALHALNERVL